MKSATATSVEDNYTHMRHRTVGVAPSLKTGSLPVRNKKTTMPRGYQGFEVSVNRILSGANPMGLLLAFTGAGAITWLALSHGTTNHVDAAAIRAASPSAVTMVDASSSNNMNANHVDAAAIGAASASHTTMADASSSTNGNAAPSRDEAPLPRFDDLPKFEEGLKSIEGDPFSAWEVMPRRNLEVKDAPPPATICSCDKCGTTAFYDALYKMTHGKSWEYDGPPWIQALDNDKWWTDVHASRKADWEEFVDDGSPRSGAANSFALIRDPKERLLSAWKSKLKCDAEGRDEGEWWQFTYPLLELAGMENITLDGRFVEGEWEPCLDVSTFLLVMLNIHSQGKQGLVDGHFRPQHLWCFLHAPPEKWTHVVTAGAPDGACRLESVVMGKDSHTREGNCALQKLHATKDISAYATLTVADRMILDVITREEYKVLGPYL